MKIILKTLKGELIPIEIEPQETIEFLKIKVKQVKGVSVDDQKIVFKGKTTINTDTFTNLSVKQNDFLVLMIAVKKPQNKPKLQQKEETAIQDKSLQEKKQQKKIIQIPKIPPVMQKSQENINSREEKIKNLMGMGFGREQCITALEAAFQNQNRAVQYLINGIPTQLSLATNQENGQNVEQILRALVNNPSFEPIRNVLRNDPSSLESVLAQIASTSLPLYNMIAQNPEAFQRIVLEDQSEGDYQGQQQQDAEDVIHFTSQQQVAVERLMGLGFGKLDACQAYLACDKNEELAANFLFERQADGDQEYQEEDSDEDDNLFN